MANDFYDVEISKVTGYAEKKVDKVLRSLVESLFVDQPEEPVQYMIDWLLDYQKKAAPSDEKQQMLPFKGQSSRSGRRQGISAEPMAITDLQDTPTKVIPKTELQRARIMSSIKDNILFSSLDNETLSMIIDGMFEVSFNKGDTIIEQGSQGDNFYILETGTCDCFVAIKGSNTPPKLVKQYEPGESFGELALMYNSPRAASIIATSDVVVWGMDRLTFRKGVMETTSAKRQHYEDLLQHVPVLQVLDRYERAKVADAIRELDFMDGERIITQGEEGHEFYIIADGHAKVTKKLSPLSAEEDVVLEMQKGEYFGELALLNKSPRAANVISVGGCKCIALDRDSFERLLGPCRDIIKRSKETYDKIEKQINQAKIQELSGGEVQRPKRYNRKRRAAVSAEPFRHESTPSDWKPPVYNKTDEERLRITKACSKNILFQNLPPETMKIVVDAMFERKYQPDEFLIRQGDDGDYFFVLDEGICDCYLNQVDDVPPLLVKTYEHGESFGELALMYNAKRAASVQARSPVTVYGMDRMTFRHILMDRTSRKRKMYESFLESVPLLANLDRYERAKIADALEEVEYRDGEKVIKIGEPGKNFFLVVEGKAVVTKPVVPGGPNVQVMEYKRGSYFGELALLNSASRAANVVAVGDLKCVYIDRKSFVRLLGPCDQIMKRAQILYKEREQQIMGDHD